MNTMIASKRQCSMSVIDSHNIEDTQQEESSLTYNRLQKVFRLVFELPEEALDELAEVIQEFTKNYSASHTESSEADTEQKASPDDEPKKGTFGSLLKHAQEANISFNVPDLSEKSNQFFKQKILEDYERRMKQDDEIHTD